MAVEVLPPIEGLLAEDKAVKDLPANRSSTDRFLAGKSLQAGPLQVDPQHVIPVQAGSWKADPLPAISQYRR